MELYSYYCRNFSALDGLTEEIAFREGYVLLTMSFKSQPAGTKLTIRAWDDEVIMVTYHYGRRPSDCLENFFRAYRVGGKQRPRWYVSNY